MSLYRFNNSDWKITTKTIDSEYYYIYCDKKDVMKRNCKTSMSDIHYLEQLGQ